MSGYGGNGPVFLGVTWTEAALGAILVAARAKTAALSPRGTASPSQIGRVRWDFIWVVIAFVCASDMHQDVWLGAGSRADRVVLQTLAMTAQCFMTVSVYYGTANHEALLTYEQIVLANLWSWIAQVVAISAAATGRFAVIAFLLALQGSAHRKLRWFLYALGAAQATINAIEIVLIMLQCNPVNKLWDPQVDGTCNLIEVCSKVGFLQGSK